LVFEQDQIFFEVSRELRPSKTLLHLESTVPNTTSSPGGVAPFFPQALSFKASNAIVLAALAKAAYAESAAAQAAAASFGLTDFQWIQFSKPLEDVYAFVAGGPDYVVISFRGTDPQDWNNWMTDLHATAAPFAWLFQGAGEVGEVHAGFGHALFDAWSKIDTALENILPKPATGTDPGQLANTAQRTLWLTGHSLGAALAVLTGAAFSMWTDDVKRQVNGIYTFGQPRVGLYEFCGNYDHQLRSRTFRFVNKKDMVPRVPFRGWDYSDVGQMIHFDSNDEPRLESAEWNNFLSRNLQSFSDFFDIVNRFHTGVDDHDMAGYERLVQSNAAKLDKLFSQMLRNTGP
jgi:triacylglycerol lipase